MMLPLPKKKYDPELLRIAADPRIDIEKVQERYERLAEVVGLEPEEVVKEIEVPVDRPVFVEYNGANPKNEKASLMAIDAINRDAVYSVNTDLIVLISYVSEYFRCKWAVWSVADNAEAVQIAHEAKQNARKIQRWSDRHGFSQ